MDIIHDCDEVKVLIDDILHFHFFRRHYRGMQAYNDGTYTIEILLKGKTLRLEYDKRTDWVVVLQLLNRAL